MKLIRNPWVLSGATVLGVMVAACSSKSTDNGAGAGGSLSNGGDTGNGGGGGISATATGGKTSTVANGNTGGRVVVTATGGGGGLDTQTYCNGILKSKVCSTTSLEADVRTVNMLIVLDESGSMNDPPIAGGASKWSIMKQALNAALPPVANDINFGLLLYPYIEGSIIAPGSSAADSCAVPNDVSVAVNVPISPGATGLQDVLGKVDSQSPGGGTPTARALQQAYAYFTTGEGRNLSGSKWVLLATDGGPNCNFGLTCQKDTCTQNLDGTCGTNPNTAVNCCDGAGYICLDDTSVTAAITQLAAANIKTFVVGVPGAEPYSAALSNFANAGKVPNPNGVNNETYYAISAATAQQDLIKAFGDITTQLVKTCDVPLAADPTVGNDKISVAIDCVLQQNVPTGSSPDAAGVDGYYIDTTQHPAHLKLVGSPCNSIMTNGAHHVDVIVGCQSIN